MTRALRIIAAIVLVANVLSMARTAQADHPPTLQWIRQFGTTGGEEFINVALDGQGNVFVTGTQSLNTGGPAPKIHDAILNKFDLAGNLVWTREIGIKEYADEIKGLTVDHQGNAYIAGGLGTDEPNSVFIGFNKDTFVRKYDAAGNIVWTKQSMLPGYDEFRDLSIDKSSNLYVAGGLLDTGPSLVGKYDSQGDLQWMKEIVEFGPYSVSSVTPDGLGNVFIGRGVAGIDRPIWTDNSIVKYDGAGNELWSKTFESPGDDYAPKIRSDDIGNAYLLELNGSSPSTGFQRDAYISKYDGDGNRLWMQQLGTDGSVYVDDLFVDSAGNAYVSGQTKDDLGAPNAGQEDAFVRKYDADGNVLWTYQLGTANADHLRGVSVDDLGNIVLVGGVFDASLGGPNAGLYDSWIALLREQRPVPEPISVVLVGSAFVLAVLCTARSRGLTRTRLNYLDHIIPDRD